MKSTFRTLALAAALGASALSANAVVLNFDDLSGTAFFGANYNGFQFGDNNPATNDWFYTNVVNPFNLAASAPIWLSTPCTEAAPYAACLRDSMAVSSATPFTLNGLALSGDDTNVNGTFDLRVDLYNGASLVHSQGIALAAAGAATTYSITGYSSPITSFRIYGYQGFYAMDNLDVSPVLEASTYAMMLAGLAAVGLVARRRSNKR